MRIAICDDDQIQLQNIIRLLQSYRMPDGSPVRFDVFSNGLDFIEQFRPGSYEAILLDILMPVYSGLDVAKELRSQSIDTPIIFLTTSSEFAVESYRVHAYDYILKPINEKIFYDTLNRLFSQRKILLSSSLTITSAKATYLLPLSQIEFLEINNRVLTFHMIDGSTKTFTGKLSDYEDTLLSYPNFLKIHRSYIINMNLMKSFDKKYFTTINNKQIPISRNLITEVQTKYTQYLHSAIRES